MTEIRYPFSALVWDYARGVAGVGIALLILVTNEWDNQLVWLFVGLTILFAIYTMLTVIKQITRFSVTEEGIECGWWRRRAVSWRKLSELSLRYYPTSRNRQRGWMTLTLKSDGKRIDVDSMLPGFPDIVARAVHAARENGVSIDRVTADNLTALGVSA